MFERLAGKLLNRILSKYFISPDQDTTLGGEKDPYKSPSKKKSSSWSQLGVWSGYVSLENLELRKEVVNDILRAKGLPLELVQCTLGRVEITIPWGKLGNPQDNARNPYKLRPSRSEIMDDNNAVIIIVVDGVHALFRTQYNFDDEALRQASRNNRRQQLQDSELFVKTADKPPNVGLGGFFQKRLAEGILKDILGKIHMHIRDVHIRLEDVNSDPANPFACGITLESLHIQADEDITLSFPSNDEDDTVTVDDAQKESTPSTSDVIRKVVQLNHFALYWNPLDYGDDLPLELSVLHELKQSTSATLSHYLDRCIARRSTSMGSPTREMAARAIPNHSYLLLPVDGICHVALSTNPRDLDSRPALVASLHIDAVSVQVRDFQCSQMMGLIASVKEHKFAKGYRPYRPRESVKDNPRAWWAYAFRIIRSELQENNMRWSWNHFHERFALRKRYCELHERHLQHPAMQKVPSRQLLHQSTAYGSDSYDEFALETATPDDAAGPSADSQTRSKVPLTEAEESELQDIEDGMQGDLPVPDIVLYRALVNARVTKDKIITRQTKVSRFRRMVSSVVNDDTESKQEFERVIAYLESATTEKQSNVDGEVTNLIAVSIETHLQEGCISFFSPLSSTADLNQHRRLHERFLDLRISTLDVGYFLISNYSSYRIEVSLEDFVGYEIRSNRKEYATISRVMLNDLGQTTEKTDSSKGQQILLTPQKFSCDVDPSERGPLIELELFSKPPESPECDIGFSVHVDAVEILLMPDCEWLHRIQNLLSIIPKSKNVAAFWEDISMAHINSLDSTVATLRAKAETAFFDRKNMDIDVKVDCPILRIGDGNEGTLVVDLGRAHLKTERLAGVATGQLNYAVFDVTKPNPLTTKGTKKSNHETESITSNGRRISFRTNPFESPSIRTTPNFVSSHSAEEPPASPFSKGFDKFFLGSSAMSIESKSNLGKSSLVFNESTRASEMKYQSIDDQSFSRHPIHSCFYDVFQLKLFAGSVHFSGINYERQLPFLKGWNVQIQLEKSVIPADHTLCRMKAKCIVDDLMLSISEVGILHVGSLVQKWKQMLKNKASHSGLSSFSATNRLERLIPIRSELQSRVEYMRNSQHYSTSNASSIDEAEFLDALSDDMDGNDAGFDGDWITDTDSVLDGESQIRIQKQRKRRVRSVSDVSSISDRSRKVKRSPYDDGNYLSAENLAILDERGVEDNDSELESEVESFHSAMSLRDQIDVTQALENNISHLEEEINKLNNELLTPTTGFSSREVPSITSSNLTEANQKRENKQMLKLEIGRLDAELRALQAAYVDLKRPLSTTGEMDNEERLEKAKLDGTTVKTSKSDGGTEVENEEKKGLPEFKNSTVEAAAAHARALLRGRSERAVPKEINGFGHKHSLISGLNREFLRVSVSISRVSVLLYDIDVMGVEENKDRDVYKSLEFELCFSQGCLSMVHRVRDTKIHASVENVSLTVNDTKDPTSTGKLLLVGGSSPSLIDSLMPYQFPQHVASSTVEEKLLRITADVSRHGTTHGSGLPSFATLKLRVLFGDIEASPPNLQTLRSLAFFGNSIERFLRTTDIDQQTLSAPRKTDLNPFIINRLCNILMGGIVIGSDNGDDKPRSDLSKFSDIAIRITSFRCRLAGEDSSVGALVLTELSLRFGRVLSQCTYKCRSHLDIRCTNMQLLQITQADSTNARELLGRRDTYNPMIRIRIRTQLVPRSEAGGWVVDQITQKLESGGVYSTDNAWNIHCGVKVSKVHILTALDAMSDIQHSAVNLFQALKSSRSPNGHTMQNHEKVLDYETEENGAQHEKAISVVASIPIRWRIDISVQKVSIICPCQRSQDWALPEKGRKHILVTFSFHSDVKEATDSNDAIAFRGAVKDLSCVRSSDNWPLLEPMVLTGEAGFKLDHQKQAPYSGLSFILPLDSTWQGNVSLLAQDHWNKDIDEVESNKWNVSSSDGLFKSLSISISPIKVNLSSQSCCLLIDTINSLHHRSDLQMPEVENVAKVELVDAKDKTTALPAKARVLLHVFEVKLFRESGSGSSVAYADPLVSLLVNQVIAFTYNEPHGFIGSAKVSDASLCDLTLLPGVRVLGKEISEKEGVRPHFVTLAIRLIESENKGKSLSIEVSWGRIQCILLPSILRSILNLRSCLQEHAGKANQGSSTEHLTTLSEEKGDDICVLKLPFDLQSVQFSVVTSQFDCIISSRDIFSHIRDRSQESISVVSCRWQTNLKGVLAMSDTVEAKAKDVIQIFSQSESLGKTPVLFEEAPLLLQELMETHLNRDAISGEDKIILDSTGKGFLSHIIASKLVLTVDDFQALRTSIKKIPQKVAAAGDNQMSPYCFIFSPSLGGEQRITNPIKFKATYQVAATTLAVNKWGIKTAIDDEYSDVTKLASRPFKNIAAGSKLTQAFHVDAGFVDVLVYIRSSEGGMNDALRVTIIPMLDTIKQKDNLEKPRKQMEQHLTVTASPFSCLMANATSFFCFRTEGFQFTYVPGGATRLTESPIVKCAFSNVSSGLVIVPIPKDLDQESSTVHIASTDSSKTSDFDQFPPAPPVSHLTAGGWINCEISASYHNRRLVAWEPVIEPWILDARVGVDVTQIFNLRPSSWIDVSPWKKSTNKRASSGLTGFLPDSLNERAGGKIRDFGRLLRSSFQREISEHTRADSLGSTVETHSDLSLLLFASMDPHMIALALHSSSNHANLFPSLESLSQQNLLSLLPGRVTMEWLVQFGYPSNHRQEIRKDDTNPGILVSISDVRPLNMNLTGALIENVLVYLGQQKEEKSRPLAPHWIRNDSGMTIRFREMLDAGRLSNDEKARKTTLSSGSEIPLSLRRAVSQSCDPHHGHIFLELGSPEEVVDRFYYQEDKKSKGSLSTNFRYRVAGKISVDTVGVHRYQLNREKVLDSKESELHQYTEPPSLGWIIVRVELRGGIKVVSIESPLVLKNTADVNLVCQLRDCGIGRPLIWKGVIPRSSTQAKGLNATQSDGISVPVPADTIPSINDESFVFSITAFSQDLTPKHEEEIGDATQIRSARITSPPPYSEKSMRRGIVRLSEVSLKPVIADSNEGNAGFVHLNVCAVRIGSISLANTRPGSGLEPTQSTPAIPEQRMLLFRPPIVFKNHLPVNIEAQVRVKTGSLGNNSENKYKNTSNTPDWKDLGILCCGDSASWTGANSDAKVELRVRICGQNGEESRDFPVWSSAGAVPSRNERNKKNEPGPTGPYMVSKVTVIDSFGVPLVLTIGCEEGANTDDRDLAPQDNIKRFADNLPTAYQVVGIYVPFWIIDSTSQDVEFLANSRVAGQMSRYSLADRPDDNGILNFTTPDETAGKIAFGRSRDLGLAELYEDEQRMHLQVRPSFDALMIGDNHSTRLSIRRRIARLHNSKLGTDIVSSWSDPIALQVSTNSNQDVSVSPPNIPAESEGFQRSAAMEPLAFRSSIVSAPERFGGRHGTKLIHIVNRYAIVNELGREIEIISEHGQGIPVTVGDEKYSTPLHFDDSDRIRIRPKEFGWCWSGPFSLKKERREVTLRLRHKLKGHVIILNVEFYAIPKSPGMVLILRKASHPPFRLENHTMQALHFGQSSTFNTNDIALDTMLLPYHHADFAWDEPDERRRFVVLEVADFGYSYGPSTNDLDKNHLASINLDEIAPGTELSINNTAFAGQIVADGPTRVLRITDASLPRLPSSEFDLLDGSNSIFQKTEKPLVIYQWIDVKLSHGIGISVVDYAPQELIYLRFEEISAERRINSGGENVSIKIGCVSADNQLWVTPYPVLMKMGHSSQDRSTSTVGLVEKRRKRWNNAVSLKWCRALNSHGGHDELTLLNSVELATEPLILSIDGNVSDLLLTMVLQVMGTSSDVIANSTEFVSRDTELRKVLYIADYHDVNLDKRDDDLKSSRIENIHNLENNYLATAAMAAKLRVRYDNSRRDRSQLIGRDRSQSMGGSGVSIGQSVGDHRDPTPLPKASRKYYIDKLKISSLETEINWSGALPASVFSLFGLGRPALIFEGLPVLLRQYTCSHSYGTVDDHLQNMKSHYINIWRVLDLLVGLAFKPSFMVRACVYTSRESIATVFNSMSQMLENVSESLLGFSPRALQPQPVYNDGMAVERKSKFASNIFYHIFIGRSAAAIASVFLGSANIASLVASSIQYGGNAQSRSSHTSSVSVRSRNPRLFAKLDGKDLLVEYVEGENTGKSILSRVRMGMHLGEGYIWHVEGVQKQLLLTKHGQPDDDDSVSNPLILMMTSDRVLLLKGDRFIDFCSVLWEATFDNIVLFNLDQSLGPRYDFVEFWYFVGNNSSGNSKDFMAKHASTMVAGSDSGLDLLRCNSFSIPFQSGKALWNQLKIVHPKVLE